MGRPNCDGNNGKTLELCSFKQNWYRLAGSLSAKVTYGDARVLTAEFAELATGCSERFLQMTRMNLNTFHGVFDDYNVTHLTARQRLSLVFMNLVFPKKGASRDECGWNYKVLRAGGRGFESHRLH